MKTPLSQSRIAKLCYSTLALFLGAANAPAQLLQSWQFNDAANTPLNTAVNAVPAGVLFATGQAGVSTNGAGQLVISGNNTGLGARSFANIPDVTSGSLQLDVNVASWNFTGSPSLGPLLEIGLANPSATTTPNSNNTRLAHLFFEVNDLGAALGGVARGGNSTSTTEATDILFGLVRNTPVTFRLNVDFATRAYTVSTSDDYSIITSTGNITTNSPTAAFVQIRAIDDFSIGGLGGNFRVDSITLTFIPPAPVLTPLQTWRQTYFATTEPIGTAADNADPDFDGIPNLIEYATGTIPTGFNPAATVLGQNGGGFLTLAFTSIADPALTYTVLGTSDLTGAWTSVFSATGATLGAAAQVIPDTTLLSAGPRRFLRLQVTR